MRKYATLLVISSLLCSAEPDLEAQAQRPLEEYAISEHLWMGSAGAVVTFEPSTPLTTVRSGEIHWLVKEGTLVNKGQPVARIGEEQIRLAQERLRISERDYHLRSEEITLQHEEKLAGLRREVREKRASLAKLDLTDEERELLGEEVAEKIGEEKDEITASIKRVEARLRTASKGTALELELAQLELDLKKSRQEHQDTIHLAEIVAPATGELVHTAANKERARPNEEIGSIVDKGHFSATVEIVDPKILNLAPETLIVRVPQADGRVIVGNFDRELEQPSANTRRKQYVFRLPVDDLGGPKKNGPRTRQGVIVRILVELSAPSHVVPKTPLLFTETEEIRKMGWHGWVAKRWPGYQLAYVGPNDLVIRAEQITTPE